MNTIYPRRLYIQAIGFDSPNHPDSGWPTQVLAVEADHGRIETCTAMVSTEIDWLAINAMQKEGSKGSLRGKFKRAG